MRILILSLILIVQAFSGFSQENISKNPPCFTVPKSLSISELNSIQISNECMITSFSFQLFNRWGELMRESNKITNPLIFGESESQDAGAKKKKKGKKNSPQILDKPLSAGVYFYIINYTLPGETKTEKQSGNITFF
jgi:hypothetical protein